MTLMTSMYSGWSGLTASSTQLSVIGDNIANANTIGFKGSRAVFQEALAQSMMGGGLGTGTGLQAIQRILSQGALIQTGVPTDLALSGDGYFLLNGKHNGVDGNFYTRAGQFTVDKDGYLTNLEGLQVQGYLADPTGAVGGSINGLQVGDASSPPVASSQAIMQGNLDSDAAVPAGAWVVPPVPVPFDPANPTNTAANYNSMQSIQVFDSLGTQHQVDVYFRKTSANTWEYFAVTDGGNLQAGAAGTPTQIMDGTLDFDSDGNLTTHTQNSNTFNPINATQPQTLDFNFAANGNSQGLTQNANDFGISFINVDGNAAGTLAGVQVDGSGIVTGTFTNGQTRTLAQLAIAKFEASDQLQRLAGNLYGETRLSGQANVGFAGTAGRGTVVAGALEQSNVDLAEEFINMIGAQRAFQANSKTISTADQMLQELMTLKR